MKGEGGNLLTEKKLNLGLERGEWGEFIEMEEAKFRTCNLVSSVSINSPLPSPKYSFLQGGKIYCTGRN